MAHKLIIELKHTEPKISRTVLVPEQFTFHELHVVIQLIMNWENAHLYQFNTGAPYASDSIKIIDEEEEDFFDFGSQFEEYDATDTFIADYFNRQKKKINYIYDFGDDWIHEIRLLKKPTEEVLFPQCIKGENAAPVEDCGGIPGFYHLLDILNNQGKSKEKKELIGWLGLSSDKSYEDEFGFDIDVVNQRLLETFDQHQ
ncbi:plasmid pRiA4b ORF-3 family protein [Fluviicola taffensis]|uniref:Plasmid pRiA4b ORF-3 family protein n=1 Tax=Fluviicola taffensis (strain DSM 16823 / NCIMB 13979 / RW262) TaxID=755732 RepID=F2IKJ4_FLUTR|nr:plasmid pRiA4b ORF-3 family protein [Fluviicola taffensis]AEA45120.1 plasmid pRiA4b ORF-3 family protein [Fluviicola taffensis DSM 16823]